MSKMSKLLSDATDCSCHHFWYNFPTTYSVADTKIISTVQTLIIRNSSNEIFLLGIWVAD